MAVSRVHHNLEGFNMTFTTGIPTAAQSLGETQQPIQDNFTVLNTTISQDHVAMNTAGAGKHKFAHLVVQGSAPSTASPELAIYAKTSLSGTALYMIRDNTAATETQLTGAFGTAAPIALATGVSWLPGPSTGVIFQAWGVVNSTSNGTVTLPATMFPNNMFNVSTTPFFVGSNPGGAAGISVKILSRTQFQWVFNTNSGGYSGGGFYWTAIGN